jgi:hypothetical protein
MSHFFSYTYKYLITSIGQPSIGQGHIFKNSSSDILLNNHSESFNSSILLARKKPILGLLEDIRTSIMLRLANRRNSSAK